MPDPGLRTWQAAKAKTSTNTPQPWSTGRTAPCRHHVNTRGYNAHPLHGRRTASMAASRSQPCRQSHITTSSLILSQQVKASNDIYDLHQLLLDSLAGSAQSDGDSLDAADIAAAASRLGQLCRRHNNRGTTMQQCNAMIQCLAIIAMASQRLAISQPRELANVLWCIALTTDTLRTSGIPHPEDIVLGDVLSLQSDDKNTRATHSPHNAMQSSNNSQNSSSNHAGSAFQGAESINAGREVWKAVWTESTLQPPAPFLQHDSAMNPSQLHQHTDRRLKPHEAGQWHSHSNLPTLTTLTVEQHDSTHNTDIMSVSFSCVLRQGFERFCQPVTAEAASGRDIAQVLYAVALSKLAITSQHASLVQRLLSLMQPQMHALNAQDISMAVWALATLGINPPSSWMTTIQHASMPLFQDHFTPQGFSNMAWGMAVLGCPVHGSWLAGLLTSSYPILHQFKNQELANLAWALPKLADPSQHQRYANQARTWLFSIDMELALRLQNTTHDMHLSLLQPTGDTPGRTSNDMHSQQIGWSQGNKKVSAPLRHLQWDGTNPQGQTGALSNKPILENRTSQLPFPQDVACILRCLALMNHTASSMLLLALETHILTALSAQQFKQQAGTTSSGVQHVTLGGSWATGRQAQCTVLWSLARMGVVPSVQLVTALVQRLGAQLHACNEQDLSSCLYALALLKHNPDGKWLVRFFEASRNLMQYSKPAQLSALLLGLARLRVRPDKAWMEHALCQVTAQMQHYLSSRAAAAPHPGFANSTVPIILGLCNIGGSEIDAVCEKNFNYTRASGFSQVVNNKQSYQKLQQRDDGNQVCNTRDVASLWGALGRMGYCPPGSCISPLLAVSEALLPGFNHQELVMMVTAQAKLGLRFEGCFSTNKDRSTDMDYYDGRETKDINDQEVPRLPASWILAICSATAKHASAMTPHDLYAVLRALSKMNALQGFQGKTRTDLIDKTATTQCTTVSGDHLVYHGLLNMKADMHEGMPSHLETAYGLASLNLLAPKWLVSLRLQGLKVGEELTYDRTEYNAHHVE